MLRPTLGVKLTALAVGMVGTAGVAAAATIGHAPAADLAIQPASIETDVLQSLPVDLPELPALGDLELPDAGEVPALPTTVPTPAVPKLPKVPAIPGAGTLPVDPAAFAASAHQAVADVAALLPSPAALQAAVLACVSDVTALSPVPAPALSGNPFGFLTALLGSFGAASTPSLPDPTAVQAALTSCVADVLGVLPDPAALAAALTTAFPGDVPAPVADLIDQLHGGIPTTPDAGSLIDLVTNLVGATGSPAAILDQLTAALDGVVPTPIGQLIRFPLTIVDQIFSTLGAS